MAISTNTPTSQKKEIEYPIEDGEPVAESNLHYQKMVYCDFALRTHYAAQPDVYVSSDNFLYYVEGVPSKVVSPDCYVVFGVGGELRDLYKVWEEGWQTPALVIEVTSKSTQKEDMGKKFRIYEQDLRVPEYFLYDPTSDYLNPSVQGYRLQNGRYRPIPFQNDRLYSEQVKLELVIQGDTMRFYNPDTEEWLLSPDEMREQAEIERQRADAEAKARAEAEARIAELQAELEALRQKS